MKTKSTVANQSAKSDMTYPGLVGRLVPQSDTYILNVLDNVLHTKADRGMGQVSQWWNRIAKSRQHVAYKGGRWKMHGDTMHCSPFTRGLSQPAGHRQQVRDRGWDDQSGIAEKTWLSHAVTQKGGQRDAAACATMSPDQDSVEHRQGHRETVTDLCQKHWHEGSLQAHCSKTPRSGFSYGLPCCAHHNRCACRPVDPDWPANAMHTSPCPRRIIGADKLAVPTQHAFAPKNLCTLVPSRGGIEKM